MCDFGESKRIGAEESKPTFHGTSLYASLNCHNFKSLGRVDDLWSALFVIIDISTNCLPWKKLYQKMVPDSSRNRQMKREKECFLKKIKLPSHCPGEFKRLVKLLKKTEENREDSPPYDEIIDLLRAIAMNDKYSDDQNRADRPNPQKNEEQKTNICRGIRKVLLHSIRYMTHHSF